VLVRLDPAPVVARVASATGAVRRGDAWLRREVAVASFLAERGAPVVAPARELPPGPHHHDGFVLSFWELAREVDAPVDASAAGAGLRRCHEALADFDAGVLGGWSALDEALEVLADPSRELPFDADERRWLLSLGRSLAARLAKVGPPVAAHGDAHLGNVVQMAAGPLWNDWEVTHLAPPGWDLGCLHAAARAFGRDPPSSPPPRRATALRPKRRSWRRWSPPGSSRAPSGPP
jgi:Ser/Thr protein kinase RdoA (MazF antagonist)